LSTVLGISAYYHDAAAAVVADGRVVAAACEERFTRIKHDSNFPHFAIKFCLQSAKVAPEELDAVVFYENPQLKFTRVIASTLADFPSSRKFFVSSMKEWLKRKLWLQNEISSELAIHPKNIHFALHHESHLAQAFLSSPFSEAAVLTMDAVGEWTCTAIGHGRTEDERAVTSLETLQYPNSLGLVYAAFTAFLGFRPNDQEASTMALAAFGKPRYLDEVRAIIGIDESGTYRVNQKFFNLLSTGRDLFTPRFVEVFGRPRDHRRDLPFDSLDDHFSTSKVTADDQRFADVAASLQQVLEEAILALANRAWQLTQSPRLCLAGGVALNAVANGVVIERSRFQDVFIPPDPGDGGAAMGTALLEYYRRSKDLRPIELTPWLGKADAGDVTESMLRDLADADCSNWSDAPERAGRSIRFDSFDELVDQVVKDLEHGYIVGWFQGRFEFGPRALGNRSILADPANLTCIRRLSSRVKKRAGFRPYALTIREEDAHRVFHFPNGIPRCARWMQTVKAVRRDAEPLVRGAVHIDHTTRLQVCSAEENNSFHKLLTAFWKRRGLGALLNTSFNEAGYPIVASSAEAFLMFARTDMDVLVVNNLMIRRRPRGNYYAMDPDAQLDLGIMEHVEVNT
jgi:carbamoyltransferase